MNLCNLSVRIAGVPLKKRYTNRARKHKERPSFLSSALFIHSHLSSSRVYKVVDNTIRRDIVCPQMISSLQNTSKPR